MESNIQLRNMKLETNSKKGELLIETVVAMTVFAIIMACSFKVYKVFSSFSNKEEEYIHLEAVCLDIDKYYDYYGKDEWAKEYFGNMYRSTQIQQYTDDYRLTNGELDEYNHFPKYELSYIYDGDDLILSIASIEDGHYVIKDLNYGPSLASTTSDETYVELVNENNIGIKPKEYDRDGLPKSEDDEEDEEHQDEEASEVEEQENNDNVEEVAE